MKVLLLANHFNTGGITSYLMTLARGMVRQGHTVVVASAGGDRVADLEAMGIRHVTAGLRVKCEIHPSVFLSACQLASFVKREKIDLVHVHTRSTQVCAAVIARLTGVPFMTTCHGFFKSRMGRRFFPLWGKRVIAISPQVGEHLRKDFGLPSEMVVLVRNGITLDEFCPASELEKREARRQWSLGDEPVIGIVARLSDVKGHRYLIEAMETVVKDFPEVICLMAGTGPMEEDLKSRVREKGLEGSVRFLDVTNKTAQILRLLDIFVLPSVQEGLGLSAMEAGACGVCVVASRVGGIPEVIMDGETGSLVPPKDPAALSEAIIRLLHDPARRLAMGRRAREVSADRFSDDRMVHETLDVYQKVLA